MDPEKSSIWLTENSKELKKKAERLFRLECIETLSWPPCAPLPESISSQDSLSVVYDLTKNLDNCANPMEPSTSIQPVIDSDGNIIDFVEETRNLNELGSSTVSMSINRAPFKDNKTVLNSIRGSSSNVPFMPGFINEDLDDILNESKAKNGEDLNEEREFLDFESRDLLNDVPLIGKVQFPLAKCAEKPIVSEKLIPSFDLESGDMFDLLDFVSADNNAIPVQQITIKDEVLKNNNEPEAVEKTEDPEDKEIEECVKAPLVILKKEDDNDLDLGTKFGYASRIEMTKQDENDYKQLLPTMARKYPFALDPFQQASVLCMERGESLFVAAHTSAGKTVVAEYAIAMCKLHKTRAIYTSPIKALSNQKFRDFKQIFDNVGLVTGDIQLHPEAFCLIMTTEILRSMLYNGSEVIRDLEWVVFDEVHYINNEERGHVWEEVLIMLPSHVKIVMLSATVPNCVEFADWVGRIKNRRINVISTMKRPVPLEHYLYTGQDGKTQKDLFKIIDRNGQFLMKGYNDAKDAKNLIHEKNNKKVETNNRGRGGGARGGGRGGSAHNNNNGGSQRNWPGKNDKNIYLNLINFMKSNDQLPMVAFVFSRKRCDENAQLLRSMDLTSEVEKGHVHKFFGQCVERLKGSDKELPQVLTMKELCLRGFAVHHSGILPILKEVVELLFQKGYVKILFATETFAMGVNMPARCVVFDSIVKHDGQQRRILNPGEYTQMAGRAGRRGLDPTGTVIVLCKDPTIPTYTDLNHLMSGSALELKSKFRVTYSMLLNLLRVEQLRIEDMLQRSYVESSSLREARDRKKRLKDITAKLSEMKLKECEICNPEKSKSNGIMDYHDRLAEFVMRREQAWPSMNGEPSINKLMSTGRFLIVSSAQHCLQNDLVLLLKEMSGTNKCLQILVATEDYNDSVGKTMAAAEFAKLPKLESDWQTEENLMLGVARYGTNGVRVRSEKREHFRVCEVPFGAVVSVVKKAAKNVQSAEILAEYNMKMMPRFRTQPVSDQVLKLMNQMNQVAIDFSKKELEVYNLEDLANMCSNIELNLDVGMFAAVGMGLEERNLYPARYCTRFEEHFAAVRERVKVERAVRRLEYELSSNALLLSEEYRNRLKVLEELQFIGADKMVNLRGRIACEIHHQELLITELILDNKFHSRTPAELAALLSTLTCQYNSGKEMKFEQNSVFFEIRESVTNAMNKLESVAARHGAQIVELGSEIRYDLMEVVYNWASGMPFSQIMEMTEAQEGLIVKCIQRLDEVCKDVRNAGRIFGDPALVEKMEEVSASIRRDIVFAASLYTSV